MYSGGPTRRVPSVEGGRPGGGTVMKPVAVDGAGLSAPRLYKPSAKMANTVCGGRNHFGADPPPHGGHVDGVRGTERSPLLFTRTVETPTLTKGTAARQPSLRQESMILYGLTNTRFQTRLLRAAILSDADDACAASCFRPILGVLGAWYWGARMFT